MTINQAETISQLPVAPLPLSAQAVIPVSQNGATFQTPLSSVPGVSITLTGDASGSGSGTIPVTLDTVNGNVGSFTNANLTVNAKGLVTAAANGSTGVSLSGNNTWTGTNDFSKRLTSGVVALSIVSTAIATDASLGNYFWVTLSVSSATTMSAPTNPFDGQIITYELKQAASGIGGTVTWNAVFDFGATGAPTLSTTNNLYDIVAFRYSSRASKWLCLNGSGLGY